MTRPKPDEQPTTVLPAQTVEQPAVSTAPATRRAGVWSHVPARIGKARTSTVVIACLFILLFALNTALPREDSTTVTVQTSDGRSIQVPRSALPSDYTPPVTTPTTPTGPASTSTPAATTSRAPQTSADDEETTTAPSTRAPSSSSAAPTSRAPSSSRAPATSAEPSATDEEPSASSSAPTS